MNELVINVDMDKKCVECEQRGAVSPNDICLSCMNKIISGKAMKTQVGKAVQKRYFDRKNTATRG